MSGPETCYGNYVPELELYFKCGENNPHDDNSVDILNLRSINSIRLRSFFINKTHTDASITVLSTKEKYEVHKLVLSMTSPVFEKMLREESDLYLEDDSDAVRWILLHAYLGYVEFPSTVLDIIGLYKTLKKYTMTPLADKMIQQLNGKLSIDTIDEIYKVAGEYEEIALIKSCHKIIDTHGSELLKLVAEGSLSEEVVIKLIHSDSLIVPEIEIFEALISWSKIRVQELNKCDTPTNLVEYIQPFLYEIDFLSMEPQDIVKIVAQENVFTDDEIVGVLMTSRDILTNYCHDTQQENISNSRKICDFTPHPNYPTYLRKRPRYRRLNFPNDSLRTCSIMMYMKCDYQNKWLPNGIYVFMNLQVSEDILLKQIEARGDCFLGETFLEVSDLDVGRKYSSTIGPPWIFESLIFIKHNVSYTITVAGKGRVCKHEFRLFCVDHSGIEFSGESVLCDISIKYLK